jgi:hypothetical protein
MHISYHRYGGQHYMLIIGPINGPVFTKSTLEFDVIAVF